MFKKEHKTVGGIPATPIKFLLYLSKPFKKVAFLAMLAVILAVFLSRTQAYIFKQIIDSINNIDPTVAGAGVLLWVLLYPAVELFINLSWRASGFLGSLWATGVETNAYRKLFKYLTKHSQNYFESNFSGSISSSVSIASSSTESLVEQILWHYLGTIVSFIVSVLYVFTVSPSLSVVFALWFFLLIPLNLFLARKRRDAAMVETETQTELRGKTVDVITNMVAVKQFAMVGAENMTISNITKRYRRVMVKAWYMSEKILTLNGCLISIFVLTVSIILYRGWVAGTVTAGDFVLTFTIMSSLIDSLIFIGMSMNGFAKNFGEVKKSLEDILKEHEIVDKENALKLSVTDGHISFKEVDFQYNKGDDVFKNFNLEIEKGQRIGIVGPSGSGKSTFIKVLLRQYDINSGQVLIDNQNIADVTQESLYSEIAIVPQEPMLFHRTIRENIMYGSPNASETKMFQSAKEAQAHDFILSLPQGYDTLVGERGVKLSSGQRQRIAIARAILKNAPILILDEATSALDSESEVLIQKALHNLMEGKTVIAVAHRLSTLSEMNRILVMKSGKFIEDGTHKELLKQNGLYAKLWNHQAGGFIPDED